MNRINDIKGADTKAMQEAMERWSSIAKPLHSLGRFEDMIVKLAGMTGSSDLQLDKKCVVVMCGDNGVVAEGISQSDESVTGIVAQAMARGDGNINNLCNTFGADVIVVDAGMATDIGHDDINEGNNQSENGCDNRNENDYGNGCEYGTDKHNRVMTIKTHKGTNNIALGPAMTYEDCRNIISASMDIVKQLKNEGYKIIATGEMGIGNTTTSSAIAAVVLNKDVNEVTGRGAGLSNEALERKKAVIERAISINAPDRNNPLDILSKLGGYDIAGMVGLFLGGAVYQMPVVIDGFISVVAAMIAEMFSDKSVDYMIPSHISKEPAARWLMEALGLEPVLTADMCLGEGTGAVMMFPLLDGALNIYRSVHSFKNLQIEQYRELK